MSHVEIARVLAFSEFSQHMTFEQFVRKDSALDSIKLAEMMNESYYKKEEQIDWPFKSKLPR